MPEEPLSSASYSGVSGLPSLTQRHATEVEETHAEEVEESAEVTPEPMQEASRTRCPSASGIEQPAMPQLWRPYEAHTEPVQPEAAQSEPAAAEIETSGEALTGTGSSGSGAGRKRSQRLRRAKPSQKIAVRSVVRGVNAFPRSSALLPRKRIPMSSQSQRCGQSPWLKSKSTEPQAATRTKQAAKQPVSDSQFGSFVIEGGHVEHEELDEKRRRCRLLPSTSTAMKRAKSKRKLSRMETALSSALRFARVAKRMNWRTTEYDFGGEEFEESELLAEESERRRRGRRRRAGRG